MEGWTLACLAFVACYLLCTCIVAYAIKVAPLMDDLDDYHGN
jgi:hypothetical protein